MEKKRLFALTVSLLIFLGGCGIIEDINRINNDLTAHVTTTTSSASTPDAQTSSSSAPTFATVTTNQTETAATTTAVTSTATTSAAVTTKPADTTTAANSTTTTKATTSPTTKNTGAAGDRVYKFIAAGDNIIHSSIYDDAKLRAKSGEVYNFRDIYAGSVVDIIKSADIRFINQETPVCGTDFAIAGYPNFNTPREAIDTILDMMNFDIVNIANNHMLDKLEKGYKNQLDFWDSLSDRVLMLGGHRDKADFEKIRVFEKDGLKIAFLSYTYGTNGINLPAGSTMYIPLIKDDIIVQQIKEAKGMADLVFAVMHWGNEDEFKANSTQRNLAQKMVDAGVDVIIGMHPHVLQEIKWVDRPDGGRTLIAYSLGNFISTMEYARNMLGALMQFDIRITKEGKASVENAQLIPIMTHYEKNRRSIRLYTFEEYTPELAARHGMANVDPTRANMTYLRGLINDIVDSAFLGDFYK